MYRIKFDPKAGKFKVQIAAFAGLHWANVMKETVAHDPVAPIKEYTIHFFDNYDLAREYVTSIGFDKCMRDATHGIRLEIPQIPPAHHYQPR